MIPAFAGRSGKWRLPARLFIRCRQPGFGLSANPSDRPIPQVFEPRGFVGFQFRRFS